MKRQKKTDSGITLIALVISIIVMLILAGVSLNMTIGENGIVTRAQEAKTIMEKSQDLEALQMETASYSVNNYTDEEETVDAIATGLLRKGLIDWVDGQKDSSGNYIDYNQYEDENGHRYIWVKKNGNSYRVYFNEDGTYTVDEMPLAGGGTLKGGTYAVTQAAFASGEGISDPNEKGKFTIEGDTKVIFNEPLGVEADGITASDDMLSIQVERNANVKIYFNFNEEKKAADGKTYYKLTNSGLSRSAINIEETGKLELVIAKNTVVYVDSGYGTNAEEEIAGKGGYAGIHVPATDVDNNGKIELDTTDTYATLSVKGQGELYAFGGKAGNGATIRSGVENKAGAGGGGAGAGIGGQGGNGGAGKSGVGNPGGPGESCGSINLWNSVEVYAYGGAGGSGGAGLKSTGGGGGGYPGAGIGGGGAGGGGGTCCTGSGGYSGGTGEGGENTIEAKNGEHGGTINSCNYHGGGYFSGGLGADINGIDRETKCLGGFNAPSYVRTLTDRSGVGGDAGLGGVIKKSENSYIYAFNGNLYSDGTSYENGKNQCPIYLQFGKVTAKYTYEECPADHFNSGTQRTFLLALVSEEDSITPLGYSNKLYTTNDLYKNNRYVTKNSVLSNVDMSTQGVGSGAGYNEISNGSYDVDSSLN